MYEAEIRNYAPSDFEQCRILWVELTQYHREIYGDPSIGGENPGQFFDEHLAEVGPENIWVAQKEELIIGMISLVVNGAEAEVEPVIVKSGYRNQGLGRILVHHVIEQAKKLGIHYLCVKPVARNKDAISFFYKTDFRKLGHIQMCMDLEMTENDKWRKGLDFLGNIFEY